MYIYIYIHIFMFIYNHRSQAHERWQDREGGGRLGGSHGTTGHDAEHPVAPTHRRCRGQAMENLGKSIENPGKTMEIPGKSKTLGKA